MTTRKTKLEVDRVEFFIQSLLTSKDHKFLKNRYSVSFQKSGENSEEKPERFPVESLQALRSAI